MRKCSLLALLLVLLAATPYSLFAQVVTVEKTLLNTFLLSKFYAGKVFLKNGAVQEADLNYDTETKNVVFKSNGQIMTVTNHADVDSIIMANRKFVPFESTFYEVLENSTIGLFATYINKRKPIVASTNKEGTKRGVSDNANSAVAPAYVSRPNQLNYKVDVLSQYWLKRGNSFYKANNEKQLLKVFPLKDNEVIKNYIKENNIDFGNPDDLIRLVAYCNTQLK
ncbi:hypothetical protein [Paraflavitalea sp. CAU 1676]|uniref:hypothetical protein n=1 Tax=Paraflavitalea sp. CAU 1676 TaxID=3032598 RepID=UPI0023D9C1BD|nr:hypothetical protein [Paraflavitalea sp. CAU 1676]MDF2192250.1 hypothetical protein [Paraflavitalea sp. CAU 1676]